MVPATPPWHIWLLYIFDILHKISILIVKSLKTSLEMVKGAEFKCYFDYKNIEYTCKKSSSDN